MGFFITDSLGNIVEINQKAKQIFGWLGRESESLKAKELNWKIIRNDGTDMPKNEYPWIVASREKRSLENLEMGVKKDCQEVIWLSVTSTPVSSFIDRIFTAYVDITKWKKVEKKLQNSEIKYRALMQDAAEAILIANLQGKILEANYKATEILGYQREELVQMHTNQIHPPEAQQKVITAILETAKKGKKFIPNILALRKDGNWIWVNIIYKIIQLAQDEKLYQVILQDITPYVITEAALRDSEERFRATFEQSVLGIFLATLSGKIFRINQAFTNILGYSDPDLSNFNFVDIIEPEQRQAYEINLRSIIAGKILNFATENRLIHQNGRFIWSSLTVSLIKISEEKKYLIGLVENITQRKQIEFDLKKSEERWQLALRGNNDGIWDYNLKTNECFYSDRCQEILGYKGTDIFHNLNDWKNRIHPDDINLFTESIQQHLDRQKYYFIAEYRIRCKDNTYKWILDRGQALWDEAGNPLRIVGSHTDITERKRAEEYLRRQTQQEQLIRKIIERIRQSLNLSEILQTAVDEVRNILQVEGVIIQRKISDKSVIVVAESLAFGKPLMLDWEMNDYIITTQEFTQGKKTEQVIVIEDIERSNMRLCSNYLLDFFQIKACLIMPIFIQKSTVNNSQKISLLTREQSNSDEPLWGILVAHHFNNQRKWQEWEINLLEQLRIQLEIAIQQSKLYQELQNTNEKLYKLATLDGLTQIANRRYFNEYLEQEWLRMAREKKPLSLIMCDIDFFKKYNDTYGHQKGDECLQQIAKAISAVVKRPADLVARYGGEELAIILPNTNLKGAIYIANIIRQEVCNLQIPHQESPIYKRVTISLGVYTIIPFPEATYKSLIAAADQALYQAKEKGRNQVIPYVGDIIIC
ncbi:PAS domain S-box protein [Dapis sp. BLCC M126]|uniref:PAS domain S-box protein n=1 Tax=Dapis sp. BLCC M126 TaxID=3400189 RepID=UPI003CF2F795